MSLSILNNNYKIIEINNKSSNLKKFSEHIRSMKDYICKRSASTKASQIEGNQFTPFHVSPRKEQNINSTLLNELKQLKANDLRFCFTIYEKQHDRPTAILFARKGSKNDTYILSLICKFEGAQSHIIDYMKHNQLCADKLLMNELIIKAKSNNIKNIYVESVSDTTTFYKHYEFETDSETDFETDSDKKLELSGYILEVDKYQIGGSNKELEKYYFNLYLIKSKYFIDLIKNDNVISNIELHLHLHPIYLYSSLEIIKINTGTTPVSGVTMKDSTYNEKILLLEILDNLSKNNYIWKTFININDNDDEKLFEELNYENKKKKLPWKYYEKIHNDTVYIDRTILSYNFSI